jgi:arylesterase / paraoxonase
MRPPEPPVGWLRGWLRPAVPALALAALAAGCGLTSPPADPVEVAHWEGLSCRMLAIAPGPEDVAIDHEAGLAYVATTDRRALATSGAADRPLGRLFRLDLRQEQPQPREVTPDALQARTFLPQGIDLYHGPEGRRLFVVNRVLTRDPASGAYQRCGGGNTVEILEVGEDGLRPLATVADDDAMVRLNGVAAISAEAFYATNDHGARSCLAQNLRDLFGLNRGHLLRFEGELASVAAPAVPFANGVAVDRTAGLVYVASSQDGTILRLRHDPAGGLEAALAPLRVGSAVDNLTLDPDLGLLAAAHPSRLAFARLALGWTKTAPTQVLRVAEPAAPGAVAVEVLADDGGLFPAASVAAAWRWEERGLRRLLLGTVFADRLLLCDMADGEG